MRHWFSYGNHEENNYILAMTNPTENDKRFAQLLRDMRKVCDTGCIWKNNDSLMPDATLPEDCTTHHGCAFCDTVRACPKFHGVGVKCLDNDSHLIPKALAHCDALPLVHICHAGVAEVVIPISYQEQVTAGVIMIGPFRLPEMTVAAYEKMEIQAEFEKLPLLTDEKKDALYRCCTHLFQQAAQRKFWEQNGIVPTEAVSPVIDKLCLHLRTRQCWQMTLQEAARFCNMSQATFKRHFQHHFRCGFHQYLMRLRVFATQGDLLNPRLSIADIAYQYGFSSQSHYTRMFRMHFYVTPARFRKMHLLTCIP